MKIFEYNEAKQVVVCGDIHGAFETLVYRTSFQYAMTDTVIIVAGDCGFGFERFGYYGMVYVKVLNRLLEANNWIVFMRGNHDDPSYFQDEKISYERFRCVPDYSVIKACGLDILCVGGGVSIDRMARQREAARNIRKKTATYWADEMPVYIYCSSPESRIRYKMIVEAHDLNYSSEMEQEREFYVDPKDFDMPVSHNRFAKMKLISESSSERLSLVHLMDHGLGMAPRGAMCLNGELLEYVSNAF